VIILDTNVISEFMRKAPDPNVVAWSQRQRARELVVTSISVAEIGRGIARLPSGKRRTGLAERFEGFMVAVFDGRVLSFDEGAARLYGPLAAHREQAGRHADGVDLMIASIACQHKASIATRNTGDFEGCGIVLINPWSDE